MVIGVSLLSLVSLILLLAIVSSFYGMPVFISLPAVFAFYTFSLIVFGSKCKGVVIVEDE
jgi:hypothetical protein